MRGMTSPAPHAPGCILDPRNWLRHALAAAATSMDPTADEHRAPDRLSAASLLNALEHFAGQDTWRTTTLLEVTEMANLMGEKFQSLCTCGRNRDDGPSSPLKW